MDFVFVVFFLFLVCLGCSQGTSTDTYSLMIRISDTSAGNVLDSTHLSDAINYHRPAGQKPVPDEHPQEPRASSEDFGLPEGVRFSRQLPDGSTRLLNEEARGRQLGVRSCVGSTS